MIFMVKLVVIMVNLAFLFFTQVPVFQVHCLHKRYLTEKSMFRATPEIYFVKSIESHHDIHLCSNKRSEIMEVS